MKWYININRLCFWFLIDVYEKEILLLNAIFDIFSSILGSQQVLKNFNI